MPKVCAWSEFPISLRKHQILKFGGKTTENKTKTMICISCISDFIAFRNTGHKVFKNLCDQNAQYICDITKKLDKEKLAGGRLFF